MARKLSLLLGVVFLFSISAQAQDHADVFGGYSYERLGGSSGANLNGLEITGQYKFARWIGLAADFDGHFGSPDQIDTKQVNFMVGPQISFPARVSPFFHILGGIGHLRVDGSADTSFATAIGGGIDMRLGPVVSWRMFQADDVVTRFFGGTQNNTRISTGLVFRF